MRALPLLWWLLATSALGQRSQRRPQRRNLNINGANGLGQTGLLGQGLGSSAMTVISTSPPDGTIAKAGQGIRLSCKTNQKWFFCVWR